MKNGEVAGVAEATKVEPGSWLGSGGGPSDALECKDDGGELVASFRLSEVSGYTIDTTQPRNVRVEAV